MNERRLTGAELEASRWIARLEASDVTLDDHQRFRAWLDAAPENRAAHRAVSQTFDKLDALKLLSPKPSLEPARPTLSRRALLVGSAGGAIAASAALGVSLLTPSTTFAATHETPIGGRETARLSDGSQIELNADTRVSAAFTERTRIVHHERGEALFIVSDDIRPFEVRTSFGSVTAEGTAFLVKLTTVSARVSILAGRASGDALRGAPAQAAANHELILSAEGVARHALSSERATQRLAWREHMLAFDGETLAEAAADVEAQTGVTFRFTTPELGALRVGGYIDARDAKAFAALVETNLGLSVRREDSKVFSVSERPR